MFATPAEPPANQRVRFLTVAQIAAVEALRKAEWMPHWQAVEAVLPELSGKTWVYDSAADAVRWTE